MKRAVIYTDLDGTLLDHNTYSWAAAQPMLDYCRTQQIPVIPCTSKTRAELLPLREALGSEAPFIVENGAALLIPEALALSGLESLPIIDGFRVKTFVEPRPHWLDVIAQAYRDAGHVARGFSEMTVDDIVLLTGLSADAAAQAAAREYGEPLQWLVPEEDRAAFMAALLDRGAVVLQGGRFAHVSGATDKGRALSWLTHVYAQTWGMAPISIAAGDSHNDVAMLEAADWALIVRSPAHAPPALGREVRCLVSESQGPAGWSEGLAQILAAIKE